MINSRLVALVMCLGISGATLGTARDTAFDMHSAPALESKGICDPMDGTVFDLKLPAGSSILYMRLIIFKPDQVMERVGCVDLINYAYNQAGDLAGRHINLCDLPAIVRGVLDYKNEHADIRTDLRIGDHGVRLFELGVFGVEYSHHSDSKPPFKLEIGFHGSNADLLAGSQRVVDAKNACAQQIFDAAQVGRRKYDNTFTEEDHGTEQSLLDMLKATIMMEVIAPVVGELYQ